MKKQRESSGFLKICVNSRNKRLGAAVLAEERRVQVVLRRDTNFRQPLVLGQTRNQRVKIGGIRGGCLVDSKRTIVRRRHVLLRDHNERPRISRLRATPSSLATFGNSPQVTKPAERNKATLGALCANVKASSVEM